MTPSPVIPDTAHLGRTALIVTNLNEMSDFYQTVVGLKTLTETETRITLGTDETPLLVLKRDETASPRTQDEAGLFHNAFRVPSRAALGASLDRIRDGWQLEGAADHYVSEALYLTDPEGNGVEIYTDRPSEEWPRNDDGTVHIGTVSPDLADIGAQSDGESTVPVETTVGHVHLEVSSIPAARAFYVNTLGLRVQTEVPSALFLAAGEYHHHLGINTWNDRSQPRGGRGVAWFEFVLPDEEALNMAHRGLAETAVPVTERENALEITDPDGITIRLRTA